MTENEYRYTSKALQNLAKDIPLHWGRIQNNTTDKKIDMFKCTTLNALEKEISELPREEQIYFKRRWFIWRCSKVDEYLFYKAPNVQQNPNPRDQSWDIVFTETKQCFDVKGTLVPRSLQNKFVLNEEYEAKLIEFYYKNQSKGRRYNIQNRLFIVHHSFKNIERNMYLRCHWELKNIAYQDFNRLISTSNITLIKYKSVLAKCIFIIESEDNNFYYKII